jgi:tricorn protease
MRNSQSPDRSRPWRGRAIPLDPWRAVGLLAPCLLLFLLPSTVQPAQPAPRQGYYRYPTIHGDRIVFTAEGDLWSVDAAGGIARRLTTHPEEEIDPAISPDGSTIAFTASYEGSAEVYTMPVEGGVPTRRTWNGQPSFVTGWTPAGDILYTTERFSTLPDAQLIRLNPNSGRQVPIELSQAAEGCYDSTGAVLFFTRFAFQGSHTKRYRGGTAQNIWRYDAGQPEAVPLTSDYPGTSKNPMFWRGRVYFLSDRDGVMNLWSMTGEGRDLRQETRRQGLDLRSASLSDGRIVYRCGADLFLYNIASREDRPLVINLASDFDQMRETWVHKPADYLSAVHPSPKGDRIVLTSRGQVFVAPAKEGRLVEVTRRPGVRYRSARFLPDGRSLVAFSDESGEVELWRLPANGAGAGRQLTQGGTVLRFDGLPSPDGDRVAFQDKNQVLWVCQLATGDIRKVAESPEGSFSGLCWSPDSKWLAFVQTASTQFSQILLYSVETGTSAFLTDDRYDSYSPAWSPDGRWIYFLSDRTLRSYTRSVWGSRQPEPFFDKATGVYQTALRTGLRSPFQPPDELHTAEGDSVRSETSGTGLRASGKDETAGAGRRTSEKAAKEGKQPVKVEIVLAGLVERLQEVPVPPGGYESLSVNDKRLFFLSRQTELHPKRSLVYLEIGSEAAREKDAIKTLVEDVSGYELTSDGSALMIRHGEGVHLIPASSAPSADLSKTEVDLSLWTFPIDPREERRQMFTEAWRLERDYFYDPAMHGLDWPAILHKYLPLVDRVTDRNELNDLLGDMVGELSALHTFVYGGDFREGTDQITIASLGATLARDEEAGGYRIERIYASDPDRPEKLPPLRRPGVDLRVGDVIDSINGCWLLGLPDPGVALRNQAGRQVLVHVRPRSAKGVKESAGNVVVTPMTGREDRDLRYGDWELSRRRLVEDLSAGEIGYVHLRAMSSEDYAAWSREFYPVFQRKGLIIDVRRNNGGNVDSWILEKLIRRAWMWWKPRTGNPYPNMPFAFRGYVVVLCDESTISDGEAFAEGFRRLGLGQVVGTRTWGGEIWLSYENTLVDNGIASAAESGVYGPEGTWLIEGHGVDPDIMVDNLPHATFKGDDAQIKAAVRHLQELIRSKPVEPPPSPPPYPRK